MSSGDILINHDTNIDVDNWAGKKCHYS